MAKEFTNGNGSRIAQRTAYEPQPGRDEHNGRVRRELFREIEEAMDAAETGNAYRKIVVEVDVSAGRFETGRVVLSKTLK